MAERLFLYAYASRAVEPPTFALLNKLAEVAGAANRRDGIGGMLLAGSGRYLQIIEGPESAMARLIERIAADPRHDSMVTLDARRIDQRHFDGFTLELRHEQGMSSAKLEDFLQPVSEQLGDPEIARRLRQWRPAGPNAAWRV